MIDFGVAKILSHRRNIQRCVTLLAMELTELECQYLHKRIAEERAELERLQGRPGTGLANSWQDCANALIAFHHDRGIPMRRGRGRHEGEQFPRSLLLP